MAHARATIAGLTNGTEYTFKVRAVNRVGPGPANTAATTPVGTPGRVSNLAATSGDGQVTLTWQKPASDGGAPITGYQYQYRPDGCGWTTAWAKELGPI